MLDIYVASLEDLQAERTRQLVNALLVTGKRGVSDEDYRRFLRDLDTPSVGRQRAPKATPTFLRSLGFDMRQKGGDTT